VLEDVAGELGLDMPVIPVEDSREAANAFAKGLPVLGEPGGKWRPGEPDGDSARLAFDSLKWATALAREGSAGGLVTGPVAKARLAEIGFTHPGQTEFVASACGFSAEDAVMMLAGPTLRTVPLTVHVPLAAVPALLTAEVIVRKARIVEKALRRDFGIERPRLALTALNPHAGEDGRLGDEEQRIVAPAIAELREEGIDASGPHPADALFAPHERSRFDAALCMYHDQALIPIKALHFDEGVNITLGLPLIRTSPDHGTAFAIAGKRLANPGATIAALRMAGECAGRRAAE
jgi:4-hydroxythreonine-4-phosphate dehydrogenase